MAMSKPKYTRRSIAARLAGTLEEHGWDVLDERTYPGAFRIAVNEQAFEVTVHDPVPERTRTPRTEEEQRVAEDFGTAALACGAVDLTPDQMLFLTQTVIDSLAEIEPKAAYQATGEHTFPVGSVGEFVSALTPAVRSETHAWNLWNLFASEPADGSLRAALEGVWEKTTPQVDQEQPDWAVRLEKKVDETLMRLSGQRAMNAALARKGVQTDALPE